MRNSEYYRELGNMAISEFDEEMNQENKSELVADLYGWCNDAPYIQAHHNDKLFLDMAWQGRTYRESYKRSRRVSLLKLYAMRNHCSDEVYLVAHQVGNPCPTW